MDSYSEVRRIRHQMSEAAGHDIRALIAQINIRRSAVLTRLIDPGTKAEQSDAYRAVDRGISKTEPSPAPS